MVAWKAMRKRNFSLYPEKNPQSCSVGLSRRVEIWLETMQVQLMKLSPLVLQTEATMKSQALIHGVFCPHQDISVPRPFAVFTHVLEAMLLACGVSFNRVLDDNYRLASSKWLRMCLIHYSMKI